MLYYKGIQLPQLRSFCVVATQENFTAAAKILGLSAPAVWQQVRALERELNVTLLRRRGRRIELTPEGRLLLGLVQPHLNGIDSLAQMFQLRRRELPRQLTISATPYLLSFHLSAPLLAFTRANPSVRLNVLGGGWREVLQMLEQGKADLGLAPYDGDQPRSPLLEYEHLLDMRLTLLTATGHPLARKRQVRPQDLVRYPMILSPQGSFGRAALERLLQRHQLSEQVHVVVETVGLDVFRKYVALGVGIAVAYLADSAEPMPGVCRRVLDPSLEPLPVALLLRKGAHLAGPLQELRDTIRQSLGAPQALPRQPSAR